MTIKPNFKALRIIAGEPNPVRQICTLTADDLSLGNVLIKVAYSSINYKDALASRGLNGIVRAWPRIGGIDLTGTVIESNDARFQRGDEVVVHGFGVGETHDGGHSQVARVMSDWVMHIPDSFSLFDAAVLGAAGHTAAYSISLMELNGIAPDQGGVVVTGATGGVSSLAIDMLSQLGYRVTAMTGKPTEADYLKGLGAYEVVGRHVVHGVPKPLEKGLWAGAVDAVGGETLAWLTRTVMPGGVIAAFGNAGGTELNTTVLPFLLRGIRLLGVNGNTSMRLREKVWRMMAHEYRPAHLAKIAHVIGMDELTTYLDLTLEGKIRGRTVIDMAR
jgi:putative YhdH/YhfP family quinone oxidoreductase